MAPNFVKFKPPEQSRTTSTLLSVGFFFPRYPSKYRVFWVRTTKEHSAKSLQAHVPLPHVFPPSAYGRALRAGQHDAIDFVTIAIPSLRSLRHAHVSRRRLIMSLVALVQKITAHPQLRTLVWCDAIDGFAVAIRSSVPYGAPFLVAAAPRVPSSNK